MHDVFTLAHDCLVACEVTDKCRRAEALHQAWQAGDLTAAARPALPEVTLAGRPAAPVLVAPKDLARRRLGTPEGRAALLHAVAHIEFNAINLACDAVYRFAGLPADYYGDWVKIAAEEAYHFSLVQARLGDLGFAYGDFPAHNGLWDLAMDTAHDPLVRMALVPRVMEARGLDVTPDMITRLEQVGDEASADILRIILRDEVTHVAAGSHWFRHLCAQRAREPEATYFELLEQHLRGGVRCPLHRSARLDAGFSEAELGRLEQLCAERATP